ELGHFSSASNFSSLAGNVTGPPLNGRAYNGVNFSLVDPDEFFAARLAALKLQLPAAVYQAALQSPAGPTGSMDPDQYVSLVTQVYTTYLALVARTVYFLPNQEPMIVEVMSPWKRVWLNDIAVHFLAAEMMLLAVFATLVQLFHRYGRCKLRLKHEPGTIASATLPPVIVVAIFATVWTWTDVDIKKMQPYVDLVQGDSPPRRSLLLDYTRDNNFFVWTRALENDHYLIALTTLLALLVMTFQPLAAAIFSVQDTWLGKPVITVNNLAALGLNQDSQFSDLTSFLAASGYAGALVLYDLRDPPFIH
ncbi:hypothetical protein P691DRAFT_762616, partial [Macrolepiota fuliginosa MF-IS2]